MAKVKALTSFAGIVSMTAGEVGEVADEAILSDLVRVGYVEELEKEAPKAPAKKSKKGDE